MSVSAGGRTTSEEGGRRLGGQEEVGDRAKRSAGRRREVGGSLMLKIRLPLQPPCHLCKVTQTMNIPLCYAEDIMGVARANIAYIRSISSAILTVQESRAMSDEITVEIKGGASYIQTAQTLIQDTRFCAYSPDSDSRHTILCLHQDGSLADLSSELIFTAPC
ncbi:RNA-binding KH domain-containing protein PEPPER [Nymphaea thermarum]|nr:RNA-binding KH domain-containing protein PEPPER [Nymphaea thermarum]